MKGITVLGGENSKRLDRGIYVKSVTEGGAAWRDGRLKAGKILLCFYFSMMIKFCSKFNNNNNNNNNNNKFILI